MRPTAVRLLALTIALAVPLAASACRAASPGVSQAIPDAPVYPGAVLDDAQPTPSEGARVERWRIHVAGGDEPARVVSARDEVLAWYRAEMAGAGYALRSDADASLQLYTSAAGCTAYVSIIVDANAPETLLLELGSAAEGGACSTPTPPGE